jgi:ribosomal-protein-serine acetyltransferase
MVKITSYVCIIDREGGQRMSDQSGKSAKQYRTLIPFFDELRGKRVIVRPYREGDAQDLFEAVGESREQIRPWMPWWNTHQTIEESRDWIIRRAAAWLLREGMDTGLWESETGRFAGGIGLIVHDWDAGSFEIGYWLRASATGKGLMTEATKLLANYAFEHLQANRVQIRCDEQNERSAAIPRRLGFVQEGVLRNDGLTPAGELRNTLVFAMTPEDWKK